MIKHTSLPQHRLSYSTFVLHTIVGLLFLLSHSFAASPPKELERVIDHFMSMESTSLEIQQIIDWRFSGENDSLVLQMDVNAGSNFRLTLAAFGMEIFVSDSEMVTINHSRRQIIYEEATPDALVKQIFVGGDLNDARFKRERPVDGDLRQLDFAFSGDFSDWESLSVILDAQDDLKKLVLVDYDGNKYLISIKYLESFEDFAIPNVIDDYLHYQVADLRG